MATSSEIGQKAQEYLAPGDYTIENIDYVPDIKDSKLTFGNTAVRLHAAVLYIDMRGSTDVIKQHHRHTVAKIQKAYLHIATQVVLRNSGHVRSFNGDGILAFFPNNWKSTINSAVRAAMEISWMLKVKCKADFERYHSIDFGIGLGHDQITVVKVGVGRDDNNNDLSWIGLPVNSAVRLGDEAKSPYNISITEKIYINLDDQHKYIEKKDPLGNIIKENMWILDPKMVNGVYVNTYKTNYHWSF